VALGAQVRGHKKRATETDGLRIAGGGSARNNYNTWMREKERTEREKERGRKKKEDRRKKKEERRKKKEERRKKKEERRKRGKKEEGRKKDRERQNRREWWTGRVRELKTAFFPGPPEAGPAKVRCVKFSAAIGHRPHYAGMRLLTY
jgi:ATPase subunit of ABC transporter with duplicated ATPase domains